MVTEANYDQAVTLVKNRFDRSNERLITKLYSDFDKIPNSWKKLSEKQSTLDDSECIFRQLETEGENINSNRSMVFGLLRKFPAGMIRDLQRYYNVRPTNSLNEVREGLRRSIQEDEMASGMLDDLQSTKKDAH